MQNNNLYSEIQPYMITICIFSTKDLGVTFDSSLNFSQYIEHTVKAVSKLLEFIIRNSKLFKNLNKITYFCSILNCFNLILSFD